MTKQEKIDLVKDIENYLKIKMTISWQFSKRRNYVTIETDNLKAHEVDEIMRYGSKYNKFRIEPNGYKKIALFKI